MIFASLRHLTQFRSLVKYTTNRHPSYEIVHSSNFNVSNWNTALSSCINNTNTPTKWHHLFRRLLVSNVRPNDLTFSLLIKACLSSLSEGFAAEEAKIIHTHILKSGFDRSSVYVGTALLDLYAKCCSISLAHQLFDEMPKRDLVSWNALITGYSHRGYDFHSLLLLSELLKEGLGPCPVTLISVIPSCSRPELLFQGKSVHAYGVKAALDLDSRVKNALTNMYAKCMDLYAARFLFGTMSEKSIISWNTMISAYGQNGYFEEALDVFNQMRLENVVPNSVTVISLLSASTHLICIHSYAVKIGLGSDTSVITSLVSMYARFGKMEASVLLYGLMPRKNLVSLTAIISGYVEKGLMSCALEWFLQMQLIDMKPDVVIMVVILHGFTNRSYVRAGHVFHGYGIKLGLESDTIMTNEFISMYTKFNDIESAFSLFQGMQERPLISWNLMIYSFVQTGRSIDGVQLFNQMKLFGCLPDSNTMASMLSGCSQLMLLQLGKRLHNYIVRNNLQVEPFVETALIDMYAKCGSIKSAERVFMSIKEPVLATWNTMVLAYGLHGLEYQALECYTEMLEQGVIPDEITFLGVLSACNHAGLVTEGRRYFRLMSKEFGVAPRVEHYACMIDLLGRAGLFDEAILFIKCMEIEPDSVVWGALLGACCIHQRIRLGECLAKRILLSDYENAGFYVQMSNLYAVAERWDDVASVRKNMKDIGGNDCFGISLIEEKSLYFL